MIYKFLMYDVLYLLSTIVTSLLPILQNNFTLCLIRKTEEPELAFVGFRISYMWYCLIASVITIGVGSTISILGEWLHLVDPPKQIPNGYLAARQSEDPNFKQEHLLLTENERSIIRPIVKSKEIVLPPNKRPDNL